MSTADVVAEPVNGDDVRLDLVFVHGLSNKWQHTWEKNGRSWIQDLLPKDIPHARIFTCGFNTQNGSQKDTTLSVRGLQDYERKRDHVKKPVIFLAHSLGGLILQDFLQTCSQPLRNATKGIIFFGTPNDIQETDQRTRFTFAMASIGYTFEDEYLSQLGSISQGFPAWLDATPLARLVVCFYERLPVVDNLTFVEKNSAIVSQCEGRGLQANHMDMTTFLSASDTNYQSVLQCLKSMYFLTNAGMLILLRHSVPEGPYGRLSNLPPTPDGCEEVIVSTQGTAAVRDTTLHALAAEENGAYHQAEEKYQAVIKTPSTGENCSPAIRELGHLAITHAEADLDVQIEKNFERVSELLQCNRLPGRDDAPILFCVHKWASLMSRRGRYRHAELYSRYCSEARIKLYGKESTSTLLATANWISNMMSLGKDQEARNTIQDALEIADQSFPNNVSAVQVLGTFAKLASKCGFYDLAESLFCDVVRKAISLYGNKHPFTLNHMSELAAIIAQKGNLSGAEALSRRAYLGLGKALGGIHPDCLRAARRHADHICLQQRYDDAYQRHEDILTRLRMKYGDEHPETLLTMRSLGIDCALDRFYATAEEHLKLAFSGLEACLGPDDEDTLKAASALRIVEDLLLELRASMAGMLEERAPVEGVLKKDLLEIYGPQPSPTSRPAVFKYTGSASPFLTLIEGELLQAIINHDETELRSILVKQTTDPPILGRALCEAAASSQQPALELLLEFGAPVNARSGFHGSALQAASLAGSKVIVKFLLGRKADMNQEGGIMGNALRAAVFGGHEAILCLLLESVPPSGLSRNVLNTSLQLALLDENMAMVGHLVKAGADVDAEDELFGSPLQQASFYGQENVIKALLEYKSDINVEGGLFTSPLQTAIETMNGSAVNQLLEAGATLPNGPTERLPNRLLPERERQELSKALLNHRAASLPYRPRDISGPYYPMQDPKRLEPNSTAPEPHLGTYYGSESPSSVPMASRKKVRPTRVSTMKGIIEPKSGNNTEDPIKPQTKCKALMEKLKRTFSQFV
ncbi:MAG: hypothetical protein Q9182_002405 [Xanthomendoza sp. 2 TL-2023]